MNMTLGGYKILVAKLGNTDNPLNYDKPIGRVIQIRKPDGGIQNQTLMDH